MSNSTGDLYRGPIDIALLTVPFGRATPFKEIAQWAGNEGFNGLEIAGWQPPEVESSGRAGADEFVAPHFGNLNTFDEARAQEMKDAMAAAKLGHVSSAYYVNMSAADEAQRARQFETFKKLCIATRMIGGKYVGTFPGRNEGMTEGESLKFFLAKIGPELDLIADGEGVGTVFENCPMEGLIPGKAIGNVAYCPKNWDEIFAKTKFKMVFDPSHMVWQGIDYIRALKQYADAGRIHQIHGKGAKILDPRLRPEETRGAKPLPFTDENYATGIVRDDWSVKAWGAGLYGHRVPGNDDSVEWPEIVKTMREKKLIVPISLEIEDGAYNPRSTGADNYGRAAFRVGKRYLQPLCMALD